MLKNLLVMALGALVLVGCGTSGSGSGASIGVGNPYPMSRYICQDGTQLAVRLLGESASVSVNGATAVDLPAMGSDGTTYSNGQQTLRIVQGTLSWGVGRAAPTACTGG